MGSMAKPTSPAAPRARLGAAFVVLLLASSSRAGVSANDGPIAAAAGADPDHRDGGCDPRGGGYVDYLHLFYRVLGRPALGYAAMAAWLAVLFYLLADTAAVYFCSSLEGLARLLRLPPAVAGATLLSLGNGAPDALSALASFAAGGRCGEAGPAAAAAVGLNGVLGGAVFVSSAVLGVIGLRLGRQGVAVHRAGFFRDAAFLLVALAAVAVVLAAGEVDVWGAAAFAALYLVYVLAVAFTPDAWKSTRRHDDAHAEPEAEESSSRASELHNVAETEFYYTDDQLEAQDPLLADTDTAPLLQYYTTNNSKKSLFWAVLRLLELALRLPRRVTIPDASKERWSKPAAVTAATLAPIFLALLWSHGARSNPFLAALIASPAGIALGLLAFLTTDASAPPTRFLAGWYAGGFAMSVAWTYVIASEVLSLLAAAGTVLSVDPAALGVTVLAWGNSLGDLIANVAVASRGGPGGAQVAVSGCYGGPVFNVLVGLGLSMLLSCWAGYPRPVQIPREPGLYRALGFVFAGLLWAVVMLPRRGMRVDRTLGFGLLAIYLCFLCINISQLKSQL
ncbi:hypothetical protein BS78_01G227300 [Paspalum vaginatum]|nr:hypothetical protein BS78_01G227300 [Paspalum vaginatum]